MAEVKFGKIENNPATTSSTPAGTIEMGIQNAPSRLIVKYITDMYSEPLVAAIRETVSNASDAALKKGSNYNDGVFVRVEPGDVDGKPFFEVRDLGDGMTRDKLINVYTQYGVSDKRDEDGSLGAFGLGAKSPLAYTTEFDVITRSEDDGTLYVHCYRTPDDDFLADEPRAIDGKATLPDNLASIMGKKGAVKVIEDPFTAGETGTVVRFPLKDRKDRDKAVQVLREIDSLIYNCGEGSITSAEKAFEPANYLVGTYEVVDDEGSAITAKIYFRDIAPGNKYSRYATNRPIGNIIELVVNRHETLLERTTLFKVGNWCYPADGSFWLSNKNPHPSADYNVIIDVPSKALPFVPSRDTIRNDNGNSAALLDFASKRIREFVTDKENMTDLFNWAAEAFHDFPSVCARVFSPSTYIFDAARLATDKVLQAKSANSGNAPSLELDLSKVDGLAGYSVAELMDTCPALMGYVERPLSSTKMKNGPWMCSGSLPIQVIGSYAWSEEGTGAGWGFSKTKTCGDALTSEGAVMPEGCKFAVAEMNNRLKSYPTPPSVFFPAGLGFMHILTHQAKVDAFVIIDGSKTPISKIRLGIGHIFDNKAPYEDEAINPCGLFAVIPPKENGSWTQSELDEQVAFLKKIGETVAPGHVIYIPESNLAEALAKSDKAGITQRQRSELEKMLNVNRYVTLKNPAAVRVRDAIGLYRGNSTLSARIEADPTSWGIIVADSDKHQQAYDFAANFARTAFALGVVPSRISNIACIGSNHYNVKRAETLNALGVDVVYDESGKTPFDTIMEPGSMTCPNHRVNYVGNNVPDEILAYSVNEAIAREESDISRIWESKMSSYLSTSYRSQRNVEPPTICQFVDTLSFGHESFPAMQKMDAELRQWQRDILGNVAFESKGLHVDRDLDELKKKLSVIVDIWVEKGNQGGLEWNVRKWDASNLPIILGTAEGAGIAAAVEAFYEGIPYEDIIQ